MRPFNYYLTIVSLACFTLFLSSCGGDDECQAEAWAGAWTTSASCAGTSLDLDLDITAVDENTIRIESNGEVDEVDVDGCDVNVVQELDLLGTAISIGLDMMLNGDVIDVDIEVSAFGMTEACAAVFTRG